MAVSSSPEEAPSALAGTHLLLRCVKLCGREFLGTSLVGNNAFLHLLVVPSNSEDLPGAYDAIMESVHDMEDVPAAKTHFAFLRLLVMEVSSGNSQRYIYIFVSCHLILTRLL